MAGGELRRSYTQMDFSLNRVNIRPHLPHLFHQQPPLQVRDPRRRYSAMPGNGKMKHPTLDIYRPPSVRLEGAQNGMAATQRSLNVHAPEFTMNKIQSSRSTSNMMMNGYGMMAPQGFGGKGPMMHPGKVAAPPMMNPLQMSKSSGNVLHPLQPQPAAMAPNTVHQMQPRAVHFQDPVMTAHTSHKSSGSGLKRSKSLSATDTLRTSPIMANNSDLGSFSAEVQTDLQQAIKDPNEMSARSLMTLAKLIVERATSDRRYAEPAAKICINVIEKEKKETFLESLLNTCQLSYQERDKVLRSAPTGSRYRQYMTFLNEMYVQLKRSQLQLKTQYDGVPPQLMLLTLLSKCFIDCLQAKPLSKIEIEAIFFILTSIGKDLEHDLPKTMEQIFFNIRDVFLTPTSAGPIKSTLLQLIELRASKWQMPASAVMYYYPGAR
uniref:MIF4G domain-containing protein n=1 Tax=Graphocephala atropunctata TaxID=36148 RepID=A0A1B6MQW4_9HEMI